MGAGGFREVATENVGSGRQRGERERQTDRQTETDRQTDSLRNTSLVATKVCLSPDSITLSQQNT